MLPRGARARASTRAPASASRFRVAKCRASRRAPRSRQKSRAELSSGPFADRLAALVEERRSQVCLGLDPDPALLSGEDLGPTVEGTPAQVAARAVSASCRTLIDRAGPHCVAVKPQLACFERIGSPGWTALAEVCEPALAAGLLVVADGKRG